MENINDSPIKTYSEEQFFELQKAVNDNDLGTIERLCGAGCAELLINSTDAMGRSPLYIAASQGHTEAMKVLLAHGALLDGEDMENLTPVQVAVANGHVAATKLLIAAGADVGGDITINALMHEESYLAHLRLLIDNGADVCAVRVNGKGWCPILEAAYRGRPDAIELLYAEGADLNSKLDHNGITALHRAVIEDKVEVLDRLLVLSEGDRGNPRGIAIDTEDKRKRTPLNLAADRGRASCLALLLAHGANVTCIGPIGETPLHNAATIRSPECIEALLDNGAVVDATDKRGRTPLDSAKVKYHTPSKTVSIKILLAAGA